MRHYFIFSLLFTCIHSYTPQADLQIPASVAGEEKYNELLKLGSSPKYGKCWTTALSNLQETCRSLNDKSQQRLALSFTNCHLIMSGKSELSCIAEEEPSDCLSRMGDLAFQLYTQFFMHSENLCFFIQAQLWQQWQSQTVKNLAESTASVVDTLGATQDLQKQIINTQEEALARQEQLSRNGDAMHQLVVKIVRDVQETLLNTHEKFAKDFNEIFVSIDYLRATLLGEFSAYASFFCFALALFAGYFTTCTRRTNSVRLPLFVLSVLEFALELSFPSILAISDESFVFKNETLYSSRWTLRKAFFTLAVIVLLYAIFTYKDYNRENNKLLLEIHGNLPLLLDVHSKISNMVSPIGENFDEHQNAETETTLPDGSFVRLQRFMTLEEARQNNDNLPSDDDEPFYEQTSVSSESHLDTEDLCEDSSEDEVPSDEETEELISIPSVSDGVFPSGSHSSAAVGSRGGDRPSRERLTSGSETTAASSSDAEPEEHGNRPRNRRQSATSSWTSSRAGSAGQLTPTRFSLRLRSRASNDVGTPANNLLIEDENEDDFARAVHRQSAMLRLRSNSRQH